MKVEGKGDEGKEASPEEGGGTSHEFNLLAELIVQNDNDNFKLNLFPDLMGGADDLQAQNGAAKRNDN